jgi:PAS domain S-box-containing protein
MPRDAASEPRWGQGFQQLFESFPGAAIVTDPETGTILDANQMACDLLHRSREELLGLDQARLHPAQDAEQYRVLFQDRLPREQMVKGEIGLCCPSGEVLQVKASARMLELGGEQVACTLFLPRAQAVIESPHDELVALNAIASTVAGSLNLDEIMNRALEQVLEVMNVEAGVITLSDAEKGEMRLVAHRGLSDEFVENMRRQRREVARHLASITPGTGEAILIEDLWRDPRAALFGGDFEREQLRSSAAVPLQSKGNVVGTLAVISREPRLFTPPQVELLTSIGRHVGMAVENARLHDETSRRLRELSATEEIMGQLSSTLDVDKVIQLVLDKAMEATNASAGSIDLVAEDHSHLIWLAHRGYPAEAAAQYADFSSIERGIIGRVARSGRLSLVDDVSKDPDYMEIVPSTRSQLTVPIVIENAVAGVIVLESPQLAGFTREHAGFVEHLAEHAAVAMSNARLYERLRESETRYRAYVENVPDAIWEADAQGRYTYWSPQIESLTGYTPEELLGHTPYDFLVHPADVGNVKKQIRQLKEEARQECVVRHRAARKDGSVFRMEASTRPKWDEHGRPISYGGVARDVSEQIRLQEQLVQSAKLSAIGQMISGVAHELNNPLTTVMGYTQLLLAGELDESVKADLQRIYNDAVRAQRIVQDLLVFARQKKPQRSPTDVNEALERTLALRAYELKVENIDIVTELEKDLPWTMADGYQLQQVFLNIINNAYQAMSQRGGPGVLAVRTERVGDDAIRVTFSDNGPGIPPEVLERIFDPFFTTKEVGMGTGLGLSVSHGIIQEHGGRIWAESGPGGGAVFVIELPVISWAEALNMPPPDEDMEEAGRGH